MRTLLTQTFCLMCIMQYLNLNTNKIGDPGITALADALGKGALASLEKLRVDDGPLGTEHPALKDACEALGIELL